MRWLCNIRADLPGEWTQAQRDDMVNRENEQAATLMKRGVLRRIFRIVGQTANYSIWETETPEDLHAALRSLPMFPFQHITVVPIIKHPVEEHYERTRGPVPPL